MPWGGSLIRRMIRFEFDNASRLAALPDLPVLILHGDRDTNVPLWHSDALMALVGHCANKSLVELRGCDHLRIGSHPAAAAAAIAFLVTAGDAAPGKIPVQQQYPTRARPAAV
eukprot:7381949-Prymnesium_polylepis.1